MATRSANISVVPFGDGPQVAIGDLVGAKTVLLSGPFQGSYTLFASHNGTSFAPVLLFNSDGQEQIELTLAEAYAFVRLRTGANTTGSVTASISGVSVPGQNSFLTFPPVAINASGPQPSIDTFALVPPTGLEVDVNVICSATLLTGTIIVEGSNDNLNFNPLGSFSGGSVQRSLVGLPASLEFAPLPTPDVVRYFRINVQGQLSQPAIFTLAGGVPATGGGGVGVPMPVSIGPTVGDPAHNFVATSVVTPLGATGALGQGSFAAGNGATANGALDIVVGNLSSTGPQGDCVIVGRSSTGGNSLAVVILGRGCHNGDNSSSCVLIGDLATNGAGSDNCIVIGREATNGAGSSSAVVIGLTADVGDGAIGAVAIGLGVTVSSLLSVGLGNACIIDASSSNGVAVGTSAQIFSNSGSSVAIGQVAQVGDGTHSATGGVAIGNGPTVHADNGIAIGSTATVGTAATNAVVIGNTATVDSNVTSAIAIGFLAKAHALNPTDDGAIVIGAGAQVTGFQCVGIGESTTVTLTNLDPFAPNNSSVGILATVFGNSSIGIGGICNISGGVAIGFGSNIANENGSIAIGYLAAVSQGSNPDVGGGARCIAIGQGAQTFVSYAIAIGATANTQGRESIAIGHLASTNIDGASFSDSSIAIGTEAACFRDSAIALGNGATATGSASIAIGTSATIMANADGGIAIGQGSQCQATGTNNIAIGVEAIVTSPSSNIILIGQSTNCNSGITNAIAIGNGAGVSTNNQCVVGGTGAGKGIEEFTVSGTSLALVRFLGSAIVSNQDSAFFLRYKNHTGTVVITQVTVDAATGFLHVAP